jgi:nitroreductase
LEKASFLNVIFSRRSVRSYVRTPIPEDHVLLIMEAGRRAPTDATLQLWTSIRISDRGLREKIGEAIGQEHVVDASEFFIFIADLYRLSKLLELRGYKLGDVEELLLLLAAVDAALAAENMALAAQALGYGSCFIGGIHNIAEEIIGWLGLPEKTYPLFGLTVGVPAENPPERPRLPLDMLFHVNRYREYSEEDLTKAYDSMKFQSWGDWLKVIKRYVAEGGVFGVRNREFLRLAREQKLLVHVG